MLEEVGSRDTKNEVFAAYDELLKKLKDTKPAPTKQEEQVVEEKKQVVEAAVKITANPDHTVADQVTNLRTTLVNFLDGIEKKLAEEEKKFQTLQEACTIQTERLNSLYKINPEADTLAAVINAHREKSVSLEQDIAQKRGLWAREQETHENLRKDTEAQMLKTRQREEENYLYNRDIFRRKEQEEYEMKKRELEHELQAKRTAMDESFREVEARLSLRETKIAAREQEYQQLQDDVAQFPQRIQIATQEAERQLADKLAIKYEYEAKLLQKEFDVERQVLKQNIDALHHKIEGLETLNYNFKPLAYNTDTAPTTV